MATGSCDLPRYLFSWVWLVLTAVRSKSLLPALGSDMDAAQTCIITPDAIENAGDEAASSCLGAGRHEWSWSVPVGDQFSRID